MSHFTTLKTQIVSRDHLIQALEDLGIEFETGKLEIEGYGGIRTQVEIRIPTADPGYQIGFRKQGERYELVADWYGVKNIDRETFLGRVTQRYAYRVAKEQLESREFTVVEEEVTADGTIHVTLRRMA